MIGAFSTALTGLRNAASDADLAARRIVGAGTVSVSADAAPAVIDATGAAPRDDLLRGVLDFQAAAIAYRANARTLGAVDEMERTLIDSLR